MLVVFFRHGKTTWNVERRVMGQTDIPLSVEGKKEVRESSSYLKSLDIRYIYSSDLLRALETTNILLQELNLSKEILEVTTDLRERNLGSLSGSKYLGKRKEDGKTYLTYNKDGTVFKFLVEDFDEFVKNNAGESKADYLNRTKAFLKKLDAKSESLDEDRTILVVTHGGFIRGFLSLTTDFTLEETYDKLTIPTCTRVVYQAEKGIWTLLGIEEPGSNTRELLWKKN
ncbi:MAG: histidine phosphatase family protein [Candidatus Hermodarchaeota archaeon]